MLTLTPWITIYCLTVAALLGGCMGSFLNCLGWRIVHHEKISKGRSHCDFCGHLLGPRDLIPVFSYLFSRGRCRYCGKKLSSGHLIAELAGMCSFVLVVWKYDITWQTLTFLVFVCLLLAASAADIEGMIIPDRFITAGIVWRGISLFWEAEPLRILTDGLLGGFLVAGGLLLVILLYERFSGKEAMGGGDIKLLFMTGLFLGWQKNLLCLLTACLAGIIGGMIILRKDSQKPFAWGPFISLGALFSLLCGEELIQAYMGLF